MTHKKLLLQAAVPLNKKMMRTNNGWMEMNMVLKMINHLVTLKMNTMDQKMTTNIVMKGWRNNSLENMVQQERKEKIKTIVKVTNF